MPDIHVDAKLGADLASRDILASTFGLAADAPVSVTTGCGQQIQLAMTSLEPSAVTCRPCRVYAHREHLRQAELVELLARMPGSTVSPGQAAASAAHRRTLAARFAATP
ncbi:hypothetical protein [Actinoplanes sp. GCM10030250]|uniref:hypothetical protein n=1 Tax=Actinoplanes sp. GCM10030250 TaxID=3273376 RepID=UPI003618350A